MTIQSSPRVSVLIVTFNSARFTPRCFAALQAQSMADFEVIVIDNCSTDEGPVIPDDPRFSLVRSDTNLGFAAGNNLAARMAIAPWIATLNPDAFPETDWLKHLLDATQLFSDITMVGSLQLCASNPEIVDGAGDCYSPLGIAWRGLYGHPASLTPPTGFVFGPCAAAALYDATAFRKVGGFSEYFFCYYEDVDLAFRLRLIGGTCIQSSKAVVAHVGSGSTGPKSDFSVYHSSRNLVWTFVANMPLLPLILLSIPSLMAQTYILIRSIRNKDFAPMRRGFVDALINVGQAWRARRTTQATRTVRIVDLVRAMTWSVNKLRKNLADVRAIPTAGSPS